MICDKDIYAPNLNRLFEAFDNRLHEAMASDDDDYLLALLALGILENETGTYNVGMDWQLMLWTGSRRATAFKQRLLGMEITTSILSRLGDEGKTIGLLQLCVHSFLGWKR